MKIADSVTQWLKRVPVMPLYFLALIPGLWLLYRGFAGQLGADPMRELEHGLGLWALRFMMAALIVTPLRDLAGVNLLRFRRFLGLTAFYYVIFHFSTYLLLDRQLAWSEIGADLVKRPYIMFGMAAFLLLVPLAATSTDSAVRRLGALAWRKLHRLAYPAAILMVLHYLWLVKSWTFEPLAYAVGMFVILAARLVPRQQTRSRRATRTAT